MASSSAESFQDSYRTFMVAIFVGFADSLITLIFNIVYRSLRHDFSTTILNVSFIIFGMMTIFMLIGLVYVVMRLFFRSGDLIFSSLFALLTIIGVWAVHSTAFSYDAIENASLRGEYTGVVLIIGITSAVCVPLFHGSHKFEEYVV